MRQYYASVFVAVFLAFLAGGLWLTPAPASAEEFQYNRSAPKSGEGVGAPTGEVSRYNPMCYRGLNGQGEVIKWAKTEMQCRHQSNGQSWGDAGHYENIYRDLYFD